jgi:hypothetical protein
MGLGMRDRLDRVIEAALGSRIVGCVVMVQRGPAGLCARRGFGGPRGGARDGAGWQRSGGGGG